MSDDAPQADQLLTLFKRCCELNPTQKPCHDPAYLMARYEYHQALVKAGLMTFHEADKRPK